MKGTTSQTITVLAFDGVQSLDITGPWEVFHVANDALADAGRPRTYNLRLIGTTPQVTTASRLTLSVEPLPTRVAGTLLIPGGEGTREPRPELLTWLSAQRPERLLTVCTGAFLAAAADLLHQHTVTTHWAYAEALAASFPQTRVLREEIYHRDRQVWSSGGVTAGIDLSLAVVEHDCGSDIAQTVAQHLVMSLRREGNQSQYAGPIWRKRAQDDRIAAVQRSIDVRPQHDHRVEVLAQAAQLSPRQFQRRFAAEVGVSVGEYVQAARIEIAKSLLVSTDSTVDVVARNSGFPSPESLRRGFQIRCGTSPTAYRRQFTKRSSS